MRILHPFGHKKKRNDENPINRNEPTKTNRHEKTERVKETTPETQPDTCQPLANPLRMTHGANEGPDFSTGY